MTKGMITYAFNSAKKINMDKKVNSFINSGHFLLIAIQFQFLFFQFQFLVQFDPGIESGIELNSHSIPELTPTLMSTILDLWMNNTSK